MCIYFCIGFIDFMFEGNKLTDFTNLFLTNNFENNDKVIFKYFFKIETNMRVVETSNYATKNIYP